MIKKKLHWSCQILIKPEFSRQIFGKNAQISNFMKIRPVGAELFHVDGQTDRHDEANNRFFVILCDAPKNCIYDFAQVTARSNFTRRSAHSGLYARSTKAYRAGFAQDQFSVLLKIGTARSNSQRETASRKATTKSHVLHSAGILIFNRFHPRSSQGPSKANRPAFPSPVKWHNMIIELHFGGCVSWRHNTSQHTEQTFGRNTHWFL